MVFDGPIQDFAMVRRSSHPSISFFLPFGGRGHPLGILITFMTNKPEGRTYTYTSLLCPEVACYVEMRNNIMVPLNDEESGARLGSKRREREGDHNNNSISPSIPQFLYHKRDRYGDGRKVPISRLGRSEACEDLHCANGIAPRVGLG